MAAIFYDLPHAEERPTRGTLAVSWRKLTDRQWEEVRKALPTRKKPWRKKDRKGGRPPADDRKCFEGILWILRTGAPWDELPERCGKRSTVHARLKKWAEDGTLEKLWRTFLAQLQEEDHIRWNECFVDGTFFSAKKGASKSARPSAGRERSLWYWLMARVLRSDFTWTLRRRRRSNSLKSRSKRSELGASALAVPAAVPSD